MVTLLALGDRRFCEPFFEDTISACMRQPFYAAFSRQVDIDALPDDLTAPPALLPAGFVFHLSRCGSTLVSQWLAAVPAHRVMSEAVPLDDTLRAARQVDTATGRRWLRRMVGLLGRSCRADEQRLFIKWDSWHLCDLPLIRRAYPAVPWVMLVRDPVEVLVSHLRQPGAQMVPGLLGYGPPGLTPAAAAQLPREDYMARVLGAYLDAGLATLEAEGSAWTDTPTGAGTAAGAVTEPTQQTPTRTETDAGAGADADADADKDPPPLPVPGWVLDHRELPAALQGPLQQRWGLQLDADAHRRMAQVLTRDAKHPERAHRPDCADKQAQASAAARSAALQWAQPAYLRLLALGGGVSAHEAAPSATHHTPARAACVQHGGGSA